MNIEDLRRLSPALIGLALCLLPTAGRAQLADVVPVRGWLTDHDGVPINGTRMVSLTLFDKAKAGQEMYREAHVDVAIDQGSFNVYLGEGESQRLAGGQTPAFALTLFRDHPTLWLEVVVDADQTIEPRIRLAPVPYAGFAQYCSEAETAEVAAEAESAVTAETVTSVAGAHVNPSNFNIGAGYAVGIDERTPIPGLTATIQKKHSGSALWAIATLNVRARYDHGDKCRFYLRVEGAGYEGDYAYAEVFPGAAEDSGGHQQVTIQRLLPTIANTGPVTVTIDIESHEGVAPYDGDAVCYVGHRTSRDLFVMEVQ